MGRILQVYGWLLTRLYYLKLSLRNRGRTARSIFSDYWHTNHWRNSESKSGDGSTLKYTEGIRRELPGLIERVGVKTLLDLPCGDFNWFKEVSLPPGVRYMGGDIVPEMVTQLSQQYGSPVRQFRCIDALGDELPSADLWMCRDLIFHLPHSDIFRLLDNFLASSVEYLLITSHAGSKVKNEDTFMGGFRLVDLRLSPFGLPEASQRIVDYIEGYPERYLLLYQRADLLRWRGAR